MSNLSIVLFVLAAGMFIFQIVMVAGWVALIHRGSGGSVPFWPLVLAIILAIAGVLTR